VIGQQFAVHGGNIKNRNTVFDRGNLSECFGIYVEVIEEVPNVRSVSSSNFALSYHDAISAQDPSSHEATAQSLLWDMNIFNFGLNQNVFSPEAIINVEQAVLLIWQASPGTGFAMPSLAICKRPELGTSPARAIGLYLSGWLFYLAALVTETAA
jgi:hypothetical protein